MFSGSTSGGFQSGPTTGRIDVIPDGGLPQNDVADLVVDLAHLTGSIATKASTGDLASGLNGKQDTIADQGLAQSKVTGLAVDLAAKVSTGDLASGLNGKQDIVTNNSLQIAHVGGLQAALDNAER